MLSLRSLNNPDWIIQPQAFKTQDSKFDLAHLVHFTVFLVFFIYFFLSSLIP